MKSRIISLIALILAMILLVSCTPAPVDTSDSNDPGTSDSTDTSDTPESTEPQEDLPTMYNDYKYVCIIGIDGAGNFFGADMPKFNEIFKDGAVTYNGTTSTPSISAQAWGSLLHGVTPDIHRLTNGVVGSQKYDEDSLFPSVFRVIHEADEDAKLASFVNWSPINQGIIEDNLKVRKISEGSDTKVATKAASYLYNNMPALLFIQFDDCDHAGHEYGYGSAKHIQQIEDTDELIDKIYQMYVEMGVVEDTLFIVTADHGGTPNPPGDHGGDTPAEMNIIFAAAGKTVQKGGTVDGFEIRDTAAIVLHALGIQQPDTWTARVPSGLFEGVEAGERPVYDPVLPDNSEIRNHTTVATPALDKLTSIISADRIAAYLPMDGDTTVAAGTATATPNEKLYWIEDGFFGKAVQLDDGYITLEGWQPGNDSFTLSLWVKSAGIVGSNDPPLITNKDWSSGRNKGFILCIRNADLAFNVGNDVERMDLITETPIDFTYGWAHVLVTVNRSTRKIVFYYDFEEVAKYDISPLLTAASYDAAEYINIGQDSTGNYPNALTATVDEVMIIKDALTEDEVADLRDYYLN